MAKILVTGGMGFIGSHTVVELINEGHEVVIFDDLSNASIEVLDGLEEITGVRPIFIEGGILNKDELVGAFSSHKIDAVIHFAGFKAVGESVKLPLKYYHNNITGTILLLEVMAEFNCKNIVFSSSATVYGMDNPIPYTENSRTSSTSPYGYTKVMIEQILQDVAVSDSDWNICILRYFNPIGAHKSGLIGENPSGIPNNLLPYIMKVATGELKELGVFGNDYDTIDGTGVRDYIHVSDLAVGHICALNYIFENDGVEIVNLGTGKGTSVLEVVASFEKACGKKIPVKIMDRRAGDLGEYYAETSYAKKVLGWVATKNVDQMCEDSWNFIQKTIK